MSGPGTEPLADTTAAPLRAAVGFFSFTEVEAGAHRSYNEWHLFDHLPEQYALPGIVGGQRWVLTPALAAAGATASAPLDRVHYVTLYLLADPLDVTLTDFFHHGIALAKADRFHQQRTSHLAGALRVESAHAAPAALVQPGAVPFRPGTGVHVRLEDAAAGPGPSDLADAVLGVAGVAGVWTFAGAVPDDGPTAGLRLTCAWLDGDPSTVDAALTAALPPPAPDPGGASGPTFAGTLATIDPHAPFGWFD